MVNHVRTLLWNRDGQGAGRGALDEYVPPEYRARTRSAPARLVAAALFGARPSPYDLGYRLRQYLAVLHGSTLAADVTRDDPRVTYAPHDGTRFRSRPGRTVQAGPGARAADLMLDGAAPSRGQHVWQVELLRPAAGASASSFGLFAWPDGQIDVRDRGVWLTPPFQGSFATVPDPDPDVPLSGFGLFAQPDGRIDVRDRGVWLTPPFRGAVLQTGGATLLRAFRRTPPAGAQQVVLQDDGTTSNAVPLPGSALAVRVRWPTAAPASWTVVVEAPPGPDLPEVVAALERLDAGVWDRLFSAAIDPDMPRWQAVWADPARSWVDRLAAVLLALAAATGRDGGDGR